MLIQSIEGVRKYCDAMASAQIIAVDTETTNNAQGEKTSVASLWDGRDYCQGISTAFQYNDEIWSAYFPFRHESSNLPREALGSVKNILEPRPIVFHNAPFDIASLSTINIEPRGDIYDTVVMAHMVNEEFPSKELEWLVRYVLKKEMKEKDKVAQWAKIWGWNSIPPNIMAGRACEDAEDTLRLFKVFYREMAA